VEIQGSVPETVSAQNPCGAFQGVEANGGCISLF